MAPRKVPHAAIRFVVDRMHVATPREEVAAEMRRRLKDYVVAQPGFVKRCVRFALAVHESNRSLYRSVTSGRL